MQKISIIALALMCAGCASVSAPKAALLTNLDNFSIKKENNRPILYLSDSNGKIYGGALLCSGRGKPENAIDIKAKIYGNIDTSTRFDLIAPGVKNTNQCHLESFSPLKSPTKKT